MGTKSILHQLVVAVARSYWVYFLAQNGHNALSLTKGPNFTLQPGEMPNSCRRKAPATNHPRAAHPVSCDTLNRGWSKSHTTTPTTRHSVSNRKTDIRTRLVAWRNLLQRYIDTISFGYITRTIAHCIA